MLRQDKKPGSKKFGIEPASQRGILNTVLSGKEFRGLVKTLPGNYMDFFNNVYAVIVDGTEMVIKPQDALINIRIIEAARRSDTEKKIIQLQKSATVIS